MDRGSSSTTGSVGLGAVGSSFGYLPFTLAAARTSRSSRSVVASIVESEIEMVSAVVGAGVALSASVISAVVGANCSSGNVEGGPPRVFTTSLEI